MEGRKIGPYEIVGQLGAGGMGEVYRARDPRLRREVAIKQLPGQSASDPVRRRNLLREARSAARITHHNVAAVYDVLEDGDRLYVVMELVAGQTLRRRLVRSITVDAMLDIAVQCCQGLAAAHAEGVVHGDVKPDNIMVAPDGTVKILDFGVASVTDSSIHEDTETQTLVASGEGPSVAGTVPFMAPEVLLGKEFDQRADIFSLGVTLYSMLTGSHPFAANTGAGTVDRILNQQPVPAVQLNPLVPGPILPVLEKMLAKSADERYATVADLLVDLRAVQRSITNPTIRPSSPEVTPVVDGNVAATPSGFLSGPAAGSDAAAIPPPAVTEPTRARSGWMLAGVSALALLALTAVLAVLQPWREATPAGAPSAERFAAADWVIAVLPAAAESDDEEITALKDGLAETLTSKLTQMSRAHSLQVIPMSTVRDRGVDGFAAARAELGITLAIDFHLRRVGDRLRVNVNLIDTAAERQLDAATVDGSADDPIDLEEQVALRALRMLRLELLPMEQGLMAAGTENPRAHGYYLRATGYLQEYSDVASIDAAVSLLEQALRVDPDYARAHAALGEALWNRYRLTEATQWVERAGDECRAAVDLDPDDGAGYRCLGTVLNGTGRAAEAAEQLELAKRLDPTNDATYIALGSAYQNDGRLEQAESTYEEAVALRPHYWGGYSWLGTFYLRQGRADEAIANLQQVVMLAPDSYRGFSNLGVAYYVAEDWTQARRAFERALELKPDYKSAISNLATVYFYEGNYADSARMYERAVAIAPGDYLMWGNLGDAYYWADGSRERSVDAYTQAVELVEEQLQVNPNDAELNADLATYHAMLGAAAPALDYVGRALILAPGDNDVLHTAAQVHEVLGDRDAALDYLAQAIAAGYQRTEVESDPVFSALRTDPRFAALDADR